LFISKSYPQPRDARICLFLARLRFLRVFGVNNLNYNNKMTLKFAMFARLLLRVCYRGSSAKPVLSEREARVKVSSTLRVQPTGMRLALHYGLSTPRLRAAP
jgi:hypothetical protein